MGALTPDAAELPCDTPRSPPRSSSPPAPRSRRAPGRGRTSWSATAPSPALPLTACASEQAGPGPRPDVLIVHGHLHGVAGDAVLVRDGEPLLAGAEAELRARAHPDGLEVLDAQGGLVLPGFQNAHSHVLM